MKHMCKAKQRHIESTAFWKNMCLSMGCSTPYVLISNRTRKNGHSANNKQMNFFL